MSDGERKAFIREGRVNKADQVAESPDDENLLEMPRLVIGRMLLSTELSRENDASPS